jgi:hypothetical protein
MRRIALISWTNRRSSGFRTPTASPPSCHAHAWHPRIFVFRQFIEKQEKTWIARTGDPIEVILRWDLAPGDDGSGNGINPDSSGLDPAIQPFA